MYINTVDKQHKNPIKIIKIQKYILYTQKYLKRWKRTNIVHTKTLQTYRKITNPEKRTNTVRCNQKETYQTPYRIGTANQTIKSWQLQTTKILCSMHYTGMFNMLKNVKLRIYNFLLQNHLKNLKYCVKIIVIWKIIAFLCIQSPNINTSSVKIIFLCRYLKQQSEQTFLLFKCCKYTKYLYYYTYQKLKVFFYPHLIAHWSFKSEYTYQINLSLGCIFVFIHIKIWISYQYQINLSLHCIFVFYSHKSMNKLSIPKFQNRPNYAITIEVQQSYSGHSLLLI